MREANHRSPPIPEDQAAEEETIGQWNAGVNVTVPEKTSEGVDQSDTFWNRNPADQYAPRQPDPIVAHRATPKKKRRVFMWVTLAINALMAIWLITGLTTVESCAGKTGDALSICQAGQAGSAIGAFIIVVVWGMVDLIIGVIYLVTRKRRS